MRLITYILLVLTVSLVGLQKEEGPIFEKYMYYNLEIGEERFSLNGDLANGWVTIHSDEGFIEHKGYYVKGQLLKGLTYYEDGTIESFLGKLDGVGFELYTYNPSGSISARMAFRNKKTVSYTAWDESNKIKRDFSLNEHFEFIAYDRSFTNGKLLQELTLLNPDKSLLMERNYYENGRPKSYGKIYLYGTKGNRQKIGRWVYYDVSGNRWTANHKVE